MRNSREAFTLTIVGMAALAGAAFAADPSATPGTTAPPGQQGQPQPQQPQQESLPKSDQDRIVGKVTEVNRETGHVAVATEEGVLVVQALPQQLQSINVGDVVSIPRSAAGSPSASPRQ
jgi:hypothetical protein